MTLLEVRPRKSHSIPRLLAAGAAAVPLAVFGLGSVAQAHDGPVTVRLDSMIGSTATGTATLTATDDGGLQVQISAHDLVPNMPHAQHIHGDVSGHNFVCPTADDDADGDGFLTVEEGLPKYGGIHISLTTEGDTAPESGLAVDRMPVADANGDLEYSRTFNAAELPTGTLDALHKLHVVQHGVDANGNDEYDLDGLGESTFAESLGVQDIPAEATDVATCGMVMPMGSVDTGQGSTHGLESIGYVAGGLGLFAAGALALGLRRRSLAQH